MPLRIIPPTGWPRLIDYDEALRYAAVQGADVISNSWGFGADPNSDCEPIHSAIRDITRLGGIGRNGKGCVVFFASGNTDIENPEGKAAYPVEPVVYPARYPEVIAVGAIGQSDKVWYYSARGPKLDVVAPSGDLWTTDITGKDGYDNRPPNRIDYTDKMSGTSGACAIAAGVAALILSIDPNLATIEVQQILLHSARHVGTSGWSYHYGFGCEDFCETANMTKTPPEFTLYVDDNASGDPGPGDPGSSDPNEDGSSKHPFDAIQEAIDNAVSGDTVVVRSGTYSGNGNHDIDFKGKPITLLGEGPESCVIDCQKPSSYCS